MSELVALSKLAVIQHKCALGLLVLAVVCTQLTVATLLVVSAAEAYHWLIATSFYVLLPAGFAGIILFQFANDGDLASPASGCSHWLLRMPIATWKIALVPTILKTIWMSAIWMLAALAFKLVIDNDLPRLAPSLCLSAAAVWLMVIAWLPLRVGWHRLVLLSLLFILLYLMLALVFGGPHIDQVQWRPLLRVIGLGLSIVLYVAAVLAAVRTVALARTSPYGIASERSYRFSLRSATGGAGDVRPFASPLHALAWHEFAKIKHWVTRSLLLVALPVVLLFGLLVPLHVGSVILLFILFTYIAGLSVSGNHEPPHSASGSTIPTYLLTSPLTTAQLAWTKFVVPLGVVIGMFGCVLLIFLLWAIWPSNRQLWFEWAAEQAASLHGRPSSLATGIRLSIGICLGSATLLIGRIVAYWWIGMSGRSWFMILMTIVAASTFLVPFSVFLRWFMAQTQWSDVQTTLQNFSAWLPYLIATGLLLKSAAVLSLSVALRRAQLASSRTVGIVTLVWLALVLAIGSALAMLIPHPWATMTWSVALTSLAIPLARVLAMPLSLDWNRHR